MVSRISLKSFNIYGTFQMDKKFFIVKKYSFDY